MDAESLNDPESKARGTSAPPGSTATAVKENVSFSEVARIHFRWAQRFHHDKTNAGAARDALDKTIKSFEKKTGRIIDAYWCTSDASAVALTEQEEAPRRRSLRRQLGRKPPDRVWRLHRVTDWVTYDYLPIAELLHYCDTLAIKVESVLQGTARRVAMRWLLSVEENLLAYVERAKLAAARDETNGRASSADKKHRQSQLDKFVSKQRREILQIEDYYNRAGQKRARQIYVTGMGIGIVVLVPAAAFAAAGLLAIFGLLDLHAEGVRTFFACIAAGALGALVSVLSRMAGRGGGFIVDHEIGEVGIRRLGSYRPLIGAIFGVALYFLAQTTLLHLDKDVKTFAFFTTLAFLAGFSERWAQVVLGGAEQTVRASLGAKAKSS
jgi:hypothetical protein